LNLVEVLKFKVISVFIAALFKTDSGVLEFNEILENPKKCIKKNKHE